MSSNLNFLVRSSTQFHKKQLKIIETEQNNRTTEQFFGFFLILCKLFLTSKNKAERLVLCIEFFKSVDWFNHINNGASAIAVSALASKAEA